MFKRLITICALAMMFAGCGVLADNITPEEQALVQQRLDARSFRIEAEFMLPRRGGQQALTSPYGVTVNDGTIISALPYVGQAWDLPYGGGKGLNFQAPIDSYTEERTASRRTIVIGTDNEEDYVVYRIEVFNNGKVDMTVRSQHREQINYRGRLDPEKDPSKKDK